MNTTPAPCRALGGLLLVSLPGLAVCLLPLRAHDAPVTPSPVVTGYRPASDADGAMDEPMGGRTRRGTPVAKRTAECFPAEPRDLFWEMDRVASGPDGALQSLNFDANGDGEITGEERNPIRGRNTWLLWGGGNEAFWGWLQESGYGLVDFLVLVDSRNRAQRFRSAGIINQPGMISRPSAGQRMLGLYLDGMAQATAGSGYANSATILSPSPPPWETAQAPS